MWSYILLPFLSFGTYYGVRQVYSSSISPMHTVLISLLVGYLPTYLQTSLWCFKDGYKIPAFQNHWVWRCVRDYFSSAISLEEPLNPKQLYIFCVFPHGATSTSHFITITDCNEMNSKHYPAEKRHLGATVLFFIPIVKEILLFLGFVDAGAKTAHYNLKRNNSLYILIGGEREQLLSSSWTQKVYLKNRKGFVKLALQYGAHLVPVYCFGENEMYDTSDLFLDFRKWLQKNFHLGIPIFFGRWGTFVPKPVPLRIEMGKPLKVGKIDEEAITSDEIDTLHNQFIQELQRLYNRTKIKYPEYSSSELEIF